MDERLHVILHALAAGRSDLTVIDHHRPRMRREPVYALADDPVGLAHLHDADQITVVTIAVQPDRYVEIHPIVNLVGLLLPQIPRYPRAAQHGPGEAQLHRALR